MRLLAVLVLLVLDPCPLAQFLQPLGSLQLQRLISGDPGVLLRLLARDLLSLRLLALYLLLAFLLLQAPLLGHLTPLCLQLLLALLHLALPLLHRLLLLAPLFLHAPLLFHLALLLQLALLLHPLLLHHLLLALLLKDPIAGLRVRCRGPTGDAQSKNNKIYKNQTHEIAAQTPTYPRTAAMTLTSASWW